MAAKSITVDLSAELVDAFGVDLDLSLRARQLLVLDLLRERRVSQGKAAELLGVSRWEIMDLASHACIPTGPATAEEMDEEIENIRAFAQDA